MTVPNKIKLYLHCKKCLADIPEGISPSEWSSLEVGYTEDGLQVWCKRCNSNVFLISPEGEQ